MTSPVPVALLGPVEIRDPDGRPVSVGGTKVRALLARLALDAGRVLTVDGLVADLWGEAPPAVNALQSLVSRLRKALPAGVVVESHPAGYRLTAADTDAARFARLLDAGRPAEALALWRGPPLADVGDAPYVPAATARLEALRLSAVEAGGETDPVALAALARTHPLRERLCAAAVRSLAAVGRQADALAAYDRTRRALADELGVDPSPDLAELHVALLRGELAPRRTNLRAALTSFVGRTGDLAALGALLADHRLVTLVGPGGAGKTRLATESAAHLAADPAATPSAAHLATDPAAIPNAGPAGGPDTGLAGAAGVWLVELAPVGDPGDVPGAVLAAISGGDLSVLDSRGADPTRRLVAALGGRPTLLVLDNCEHLVAATARLAETVLSACPRVRILATSREPLGITGERLYPVGPLADAAAVRLLTDRARAVRPDFVPDAAAEEICRRLDGLPLAIELAAARLRSLSAGQVAARLDDRFRLLTGGSRTALPRHRTLRAVVDWSWDLLTDSERDLAGRLSVFAGGCTLAAVTAVHGAEPLDDLASLVDKSLLEVVGERYRMLETVRDFAADKLAAAGTATTARDRHAAHYLALAEQAEPRLRGPDQLAWLNRLRADHDNLLAALRWAVEAGRAETAARLVAGLGWYWIMRGDHAEAAAHCTPVVAMDGDVPPDVRARAYGYLAMFSFAVGGGAETRAADYARQALAIDRTAHPTLDLLEPMIAIFSSDHARARETVTFAVDSPDPWTSALATQLRGMFAENDGDPAAAARDFATARDRFTALGDRWGTATATTSLAGVHAFAGDHAAALAALTDALDLVTVLGSRDDISQIRAHLGTVRADAGDVTTARSDLRRALADGTAAGDAHVLVHVRHSLATLDRRAGDLPAARVHLTAALDLLGGASAVPDQVEGLLLAGLARVEIAGGDPAAAGELCRRAAGIGRRHQDMPVVAVAAEALAEAALATGDPARAAHLLGVAHALRGVPDRGNPDVRRLTDATRSSLGAHFDPLYSTAAALDRDAALAALDTACGATPTPGANLDA